MDFEYSGPNSFIEVAEEKKEMREEKTHLAMSSSTASLAHLIEITTTSATTTGSVFDHGLNCSVTCAARIATGSSKYREIYKTGLQIKVAYTNIYRDI